jgi:uncharacterized RDD family membrane protein YckC
MSVTPGAQGWYPDAYDPSILRWFDGALWTAHTSPRTQPGPWQPGVAPGGPTTTPYAAAQQPPTPGYAAYPPVTPPYGSGWQLPGPQYAPGVKVLPDGAVLAEWWRRLLANLIDSVVLFVVVAFAWIPWYGDLLAQVYSGNTRTTTTVTMMALVSGAIGLVYEIGFLAWKQATLGKMALGTVVRRLADPQLTLGDVLKRQILRVGGTLVAIVSTAGSYISLIDPAWLLWDPKRQTLHDKIAGTVVVIKSTTALAPRGLH